MRLMEPRGANGRRRDRHFPGRAAIDAYGNGGFRFAGMSHRGSILCLPSGIHGWHVVRPSEIDRASLDPVLDEAQEIEVLLIGSGREIVPPPADLRQALAECAIRFDTMPTGVAAQTYNIMLGENRKVAAALLAVE